MESLSLAYKLLIIGWLIVLLWVPYVIYTNKKIHPKALFVLFFAELWERFSYYGMRALLVLYMIDVGAELSYEKSQAYAIYGAYGAMVYATPLLGGLIAEKFFGYRNSIMWGGILMALGHFTMAFPLISELGIGSPESIHALAEPMFFSALGLLILGNGFFTRKVLDRYESQQEFEEQIQKLISDENYREAALKKAKEILFSNNTYHHRLSEIMEAVGKSDKAALILKRLEHYK